MVLSSGVVVPSRIGRLGAKDIIFCKVDEARIPE